MLTSVPDVLPRRSRLTFPLREQAMRGAAGHACMHAIVVLAPSFGRSMLDPFSTCNLQATDLCYHLFEPLVGISRSSEAFIAGRLPPRVCPTALNFHTRRY